VRVYPPPATVQDLRVTPTETALVLNWGAPQAVAEASGAKPAGFHIYRAEVDPTTAAAAVLNPSQAKLIAPEELLAQTSATEYLDMSFQFGHTYLYRVRAVEQLGPATIESADSVPAVLTAKDTFPPAAPRDLEAVSMATTKETPASVELTWTINTESDLAGYTVYRSENPEMPGQKLNSELLLVPTFRDISLVPGKSYFYRVGAVDQSGNESPLSSPVEAQVPGP
jgi:fibronectin type 3 domain-containing protein